MIIGVPREIKDNEFRVAMVPHGVRSLVGQGHRVLVQSKAGDGAGIPDAEYSRAGAEVVEHAREVYEGASLIVKVKELLPAEHCFIRPGKIFFTFFHFAANIELLRAFLSSGSTAIAYETIEKDDGSLPILSPMSEVAGRLAVQCGAHYLMKQNGGSGVLLSGVPGVKRGKVAIIGAGSVGLNAAKLAIGAGAEVTIFDVSVDRLRRAEELFGNSIRTLYSSAANIEDSLSRTDLLIGAVHVPGARTPKLVTKEMVGLMKKGSVIVDVSVDQGGCVETIRPTTHKDPVYTVDGVIHYGVTNMPGSVPKTSTWALTNATIGYVSEMASKGLSKAASDDPSLKRGINVLDGTAVHPRIAALLG